jgi:hypothetical protein
MGCIGPASRKQPCFPAGWVTRTRAATSWGWRAGTRSGADKERAAANKASSVEQKVRDPKGEQLG